MLVSLLIFPLFCLYNLGRRRSSKTGQSIPKTRNIVKTAQSRTKTKVFEVKSIELFGERSLKVRRSPIEDGRSGCDHSCPIVDKGAMFVLKSAISAKPRRGALVSLLVKKRNLIKLSSSNDF
jgi:hypothetical protein